VRKINKKTISSKSKCHDSRVCQKFKECKSLLERYANWSFNSITREDIELPKLLRSCRFLLSFRKQIEFVELESEIYRAMILFCHIDSYEEFEFEGESLADGKSKSRFKELLEKQVKRINLKARRILAFLT